MEIKWIKISTDIFNDEKILIIESYPEADGIIVVWFKLLALAGRSNNSGILSLNDKIAYTDEMLATIFRRKKTLVQMALQTFEMLGMIEVVNDTITIPNWEKHQNIDGLDKIRAQNRERMSKYREKQKMIAIGECNVTGNVTSNVTVTDGNAIEEDKDKDKDKEYIEFFEKAWKLYPEKKGKGQISEKIKKEIYKHGDNFIEAIERYKRYVGMQREGGFPLRFQNGSTFFRTGYLDFIGDDYEEPKKQKNAAKKGNGFHNYKDNEEKLSEEELEKMLLKNRR